MASPKLAPSVDGAWVRRARHCAIRSGADQVEISERASDHTLTRTVTTWHRGGRTERVARTAQVAAAAKPAQADAAAQAPAAARAAANSAPRAGRNARQRRSAERSARHHRRIEADNVRSTPLPAQPPSLPGSGNAEATRSSARCASEPQSPSKRAREGGETSRALALVGEEVGVAPRAAVTSPKRPRAPRAQIGVGLPCQWCDIALPAYPRRCMGDARRDAAWDRRVGFCDGRSCAPSAEALAVAGWNHDRPP